MAKYAWKIAEDSDDWAMMVPDCVAAAIRSRRLALNARKRRAASDGDL